MLESENVRIGVVGGGIQGKGVGLWFAKRGFPTIIYEINPDQVNRIKREVDSDNRKYRAARKFLSVTANFEALADSHLIIENLPENLDLKQTVMRDLETIAGQGIIFSSNSSTFTAAEISAYLKNKQNFVNLHFLGIPWGGTKVELVPGKHTSAETISRVKDILLMARLVPVEIAECPGFVYNRIKLAEVSNLFKAIEGGMVSLACGLRYNIFSRLFYPLAFIDFMGIDSSEASLRSLNKSYGDRFYLSKLLAQKVKQNQLGVKTGRGFLDHSRPIAPDSLKSLGPDFSGSHSRIHKIYVEEAQVNHSNLIIRMIQKGKELYFDHPDNAYFSLLKKIEPNLHVRIKDRCRFFEPLKGSPPFDLILMSPRVTLEQLTDRIANLQKRFGTDIPVVVNSPIYKVEDMAKKALNPAAIFGINSQKNFLENTELVKATSGEESIHEQIKLLIGELTNDCFEVEDAFCRPLIFSLVAKMFEAARLIEEGIGDKEKIEVLMDRDSVIKDMDYFGLDYLIFVSDYLYPLYGHPFVVPQLIKEMVGEGYLGVGSGKGFFSYF
jgi:3-hydroxyacyl-CoA dehydrogenase